MKNKIRKVKNQMIMIHINKKNTNQERTETILLGDRKMEELIKILNGITVFAQYFVPGYIFLACFYFSSAIKNKDGIEILLLKSVTLSYVIFTTCYYLANVIFSFLNGLEIVLSIFLSSVLGLLFGRLRKTKLIIRPIQFLFKRQTSDNYFINLWEKSIANNEIVCLKINLKDAPLTYLGQLYRVNAPFDNTSLELKYYQCKDAKGNLISDFSYDDNQSIIIDYNSIKASEINIKRLEKE